MANATYLQADRPMRVATPLGKDALLLAGFTAQETISRLFSFQLHLMAPNEKQGSNPVAKEVPYDKLLGQKITIELVLPGEKTRFFNGLCNRFGQTELDLNFTYYQMQLVPEAWLMTKKAQSRIFQHLSVPDILKKVFAGFDVLFEIQGTFQPRDYCVQYRETDFNFASRLMEEEGIFYFFKHTNGGHKMVLANTPQSHPDLPEASKLLYDLSGGGQRDEDRVFEWRKVQEIRSGKYLLWDHCFELPHKHLEADKGILESVQAGKINHKLKVANNDKLELYDYPGEYAQRFDGIDKGGGEQPAELQKIFQDNKRTVEIREQEETVAGLVLQGASNCRQMVSGHKFTLERHYNADGQYLVTEVMHSANLSGDYRTGGAQFHYSNHFTCIPLAVPFRPQRTTPKPTVQGSQTAVVVGPAGEEIFTDKFGRVKVQFHWDREGKRDANSSCWIRVGTVWAGKRWGVIHIPRIGHEVIVDFLEGDPDQPIIVGSVYNADQMPAYLGEGRDPKHPNDPKLAGIKTNTTPGGVGFNELRFDDAKGKEEIFMHGERNLDVRIKNDCMERIIHDRHLIVGSEKDGKKAGDQREQVYQDKHLNVKRDHVEHIEGNMELMIGKGEAENGGNQDVWIEKNRTETIEACKLLHVIKDHVEKIDGAWAISAGSMQITTGDTDVHVKGDRKEKMDGSTSLTVGMDQQEKVGMNHALEAGMEIHLKAGMKVIIEAGMQLTIKGPGGFVDIGPAGVTISGTMVKINSGGAAGSGSGSSPQEPEDAKEPKDAKQAKPIVPTIADDSKTGDKSNTNYG